MTRVAQVIGNGDNATMYKPAKGLKITCNLPPFPVEGAYTTCIVDFKMCKAITEGSVVVPGDWVMGFRPKHWYDNNMGNFKMRFGHQIKEFYLDLPDYARNYTDFNCGHMATHYTANKLKANEIHLYGFDSLFDMNLRSCTDFYLNSDREAANNVRLNSNWRPIWQGIFNEFKDVHFVLHHKHNNIKFDVPENVSFVTK